MNRLKERGFTGIYDNDYKLQKISSEKSLNSYNKQQQQAMGRKGKSDC